MYPFTGLDYYTEDYTDVFPFWTSFCVFLEKSTFFKLTSNCYR